MQFLSRIIFLIMLMLVLAVCVHGAEYDYEVENDIDDIIYPYSNHTGSIIIIPRIDNKQTYLIEFNNTYEMTEYDSIRIPSDSPSIVFDGETLTPGETKMMDSYGTFQFHQLANPDKKGKVIVEELEPEEYRIEITSSPLLFDIDIEDPRFTTTDEKVIDIFIRVPEIVQPGRYSISLRVDDGKVERDINHDIEVGQYVNCSVVEYDFMKSLNLGNGGEYGYLIINNTGNHQAEVNITIDEMPFLNVQRGFLAFPRVINRMPIAYNIPSEYDIGNYSGDIKIFCDGNIVERYNISSMVQDDIFPSIHDVNIMNTTVDKLTNFSWIAEDNSRINRTEITWRLEGSDIDTTEIIDRTRDGFYRLEYIFGRIGRFHYKLCAFDDSLNKNCTDGSIIVGKKDLVEYDENLEYKRQKSGRYTNVDLFKIKEKMNLTLTLKSLSYATGANISIKIVDQDSIDNYIDSIGDSITLTKPGSYRFGFKGNNLSEYNGVLTMWTDEEHIAFKEISFSGEVVNYTIPERVQLEWYAGHMECNPLDTGEYATSKIECYIVYPIDHDINDIAIPVTPGAKEVEQRLHDKEIEELNDEIRSKRTQLFWLWLILIISVLAGIYLILIRPYVQIKFR